MPFGVWPFLPGPADRPWPFPFWSWQPLGQCTSQSLISVSIMTLALEVLNKNKPQHHPKHQAPSTSQTMTQPRDVAVGLSTTFEPVASHRLQRRSRSHTDPADHLHPSSFVGRPPDSSDFFDDDAANESAANAPSSTALSTSRNSLDAAERGMGLDHAADDPPHRPWVARVTDLRRCGVHISNVYMVEETS